MSVDRVDRVVTRGDVAHIATSPARSCGGVMGHEENVNAVAEKLCCACGDPAQFSCARAHAEWWFCETHWKDHDGHIVPAAWEKKQEREKKKDSAKKPPRQDDEDVCVDRARGADPIGRVRRPKADLESVEIGRDKRKPGTMQPRNRAWKDRKKNGAAYARDSEGVETKDGKRNAAQGLPRDQRAANPTPKRGVLWCESEVIDGEPSAVYGMFPVGFLARCLRALECAPNDVLHVCSGGLSHADGGIRVDIRAAAHPDVRADGRALPFRDESFKAVLIDPPWAKEYARDLYRTSYPRPSHLLAEAARVCKPNGRIALVHFFVPNPPPGTKLVRVFGITQGCGYRIRALTVYQKGQRGLFDKEST